MRFPFSPSPRSRRGFALVGVLLIAALLVLLAAGMAGLSSKSVKLRMKDTAEEEARANARLALMIAIGELQAHLGPDRRVSAPLGILDENPQTLTIDGVAEPHWTAVWTTEWPAAATRDTPWERDEDGGLRDRRFVDGYDRKQELLSVLVSGNEGGSNTQQLVEHLNDGAGPDAVELVGPGSVLTSAQEVEVPRVKTANGAYAFWVGDLGTRAHIKVDDPYEHLQLGNKNRPDGMERILNAQDVAEELIDGLKPLQASEKRRLFTDRSVAATRKVNRDGLRGAYHDMTTWSRAVLSNTRDGGLQRDLTAYLDSDGEVPDLTAGDVVSPGLRDLDNLIGPANEARAAELGVDWSASQFRQIAPRFAMLRKWAHLGQTTQFSDRDIDAITPESLPQLHPVVLDMINDANVYDRANLAPASFLPLTKPNLVPVMVEGSIYYNLATYPLNPSNPNAPHRLRMAIYPRVALWNPYNIDLELDTLVAQLFVNGNKRVRLRSAGAGATLWEMDIPFGRGAPNALTGHPAEVRGTLLFTIPAVTLAPGETLVFTPNRAAEYDHPNVFRNTLTPENPPSPHLYYWQDMEDDITSVPIRWLEWPEPGTGSGSENYLMALKDAGRRTRARSRPTDRLFDELPLITYVNCSLQAGAVNELPVVWSHNREIPVYPLASSQDILPSDFVPDARTRDGFRLRWWRETASNERGSAQLAAHSRHLQTAAIANWNPRASYFCRTPFDNVTNLPPYFFGLYTRDLFDVDVFWEELMPRAGNRGFPFGPPSEGPDSLVLFEVPREETGIPSLGYLRHLKLSEFGWAPSYAVGNSLADPRIGRTGTVPVLTSSNDRLHHGWNQYRFGWDGSRITDGPDDWARLFREILFNMPETQQVVHDLSYELNHTLWDDYFLSTGDAARKRLFVKSRGAHALPNGRFRFYGDRSNSEGDLNDFHRAASRLMLEGGFNVHSTSVAAWKAVLASTIDTGYSASAGAVPFPRLLNPPRGEWLNGTAYDPEAMAGYRSLTESQIDALAREIVREVKERAPFFGLADFINRRLIDDAHGDKGPIEAAISRAGLNVEFDREYSLDNTRPLPNVAFDNMPDTTRLEQTLKPSSVAWGLPGYLTQGDVVQVVGSTLRPRSDSFVIRAYGESRDANGNLKARAWCEAVVQRTPEPVTPDETGLNPDPDANPDLGRRFEQVSFRWLSADEV